MKGATQGQESMKLHSCAMMEHNTDMKLMLGPCQAHARVSRHPGMYDGVSRVQGEKIGSSAQHSDSVEMFDKWSQKTGSGAWRREEVSDHIQAGCYPLCPPFMSAKSAASTSTFPCCSCLCWRFCSTSSGTTTTAARNLNPAA